MADLPFTDTHVHFWDLRNPKIRYEWLLPEETSTSFLGEFGALKRERYWADDFLAEVRFQNVGKMVHVDVITGPNDPVEETRWVQAFADRLGVPNGIVAQVDLSADDAPAAIASHAESRNLRGIRNLFSGMPVTDERWQRGYAALEEHGLVYCSGPLVDVVDDAVQLVRAFPGITYCVDHAGWPTRRDADFFREWKGALRKFARNENTVIKISGLGMYEHAWTVESMRPWVLECIDAWGADRAFFATNWPVDSLWSSYGDVVDAYREIIGDFTLAEREKLFSGNADRVFRL